MNEKKNGSSGGELEQVGPYQLREQVPQDPGSQGELYRATHETSGAPALVLTPAAGEGETAPKDWRVSLSSSASENYVAMQVEQTPWAVAPDKQSVESLVCTLEGVQEGVQRMARALDEPRPPRPLLRLGLSVASAAAVYALVFALVRLVSGSPPPSSPPPLSDAPPVLTSHDEQAAAGTPDDPFPSGTLVDTSDAGEDSVLARPLPREPFKEQKRPPCRRTSEVELIGACWTPHKLKAPCPEELYEYQGECYLPAFSAKSPMPQSLGQ